LSAVVYLSPAHVFSNAKFGLGAHQSSLIVIDFPVDARFYLERQRADPVSYEYSV